MGSFLSADATKERSAALGSTSQKLWGMKFSLVLWLLAAIGTPLYIGLEGLHFST